MIIFNKPLYFIFCRITAYTPFETYAKPHFQTFEVDIFLRMRLNKDPFKAKIKIKKEIEKYIADCMEDMAEDTEYTVDRIINISRL